MVLRIHPAPPPYGDRQASSTNSNEYSSQHQMEIWIPVPQQQPSGEKPTPAGQKAGGTGGSSLGRMLLLLSSILAFGIVKSYFALFLTSHIWVYGLLLFF